MVEHILRRFLEHPSRHLIVVIVTFVIGLVAVWPTADDYFALTGEHADLSSTIARTEKTLSRLSHFEKRVDERVSELGQRESETISDKAARDFRARVVDLAREHGCQVRRINLSEAKTRKWMEKDSPLDRNSRAARGKETKFDLRVHQFKLTVIGPQPAITTLLDELQTDGKLMYTTVFLARPTAQDRQTTEVEIELMLFDLAGDPTVSA